MYSTLSDDDLARGEQVERRVGAPMAIPSSTAMVSNSAARRPARFDALFDLLADLVPGARRPGTNCVERIGDADDRPGATVPRACRWRARGFGPRPSDEAVVVAALLSGCFMVVRSFSTVVFPPRRGFRKCGSAAFGLTKTAPFRASLLNGEALLSGGERLRLFIYI